MSGNFVYIIGGAIVYYLTTMYETKTISRTIAEQEKQKKRTSERPGNAFDIYGFVNGETYLRDDIIKDRAKFSDSNINEESLFKEFGVRLGDPNRYRLVKKETEISKTLFDYPTKSKIAPVQVTASHFQME